MSREKQIEEMTKITCQMYCRDKEKKCAGVQECDCKCLQYNRCEALYNAGYRKQLEGEWIINRGGGWLCRNCKKYSTGLKPFCSYCGAKMKGDEGK